MMTLFSANMKQEVAFVLEEASWPAFLLDNGGVILRANSLARNLAAGASDLGAILVAGAGEQVQGLLCQGEGKSQQGLKLQVKCPSGQSLEFASFISPVVRGSQTYYLLQLFGRMDESVWRSDDSTQPIGNKRPVTGDDRRSLPGKPVLGGNLPFWLDAAEWPAFLVGADGQIQRANANALLTLGSEISELTQFLSLLCGPMMAGNDPRLGPKSIGPVVCSFAAAGGGKEDFQAYLSPVAEGDSGDYLLQLFKGGGPPAPTNAAPTEPPLASPSPDSAPEQGLKGSTPGDTANSASADAQSQKLECALQLARSVVLDFNNALTSILGHASLVLGQIPSNNPWRNSLLDIEKAAERAAEIVQDLDNFSRQDKEPQTQTGGSINEVLERALTAHKSTASPSIEWTTAFEKRIYAASFDEAKLQHAFVKIIENAVEASGGKGRIKAATRNVDCISPFQDGTIQVPAGHHVCVEITDHGVGIPAEVLPRVFEPFFTTKQDTKHRGLGLAWVYGIVTNHGGRVAVISQKGMGTSVRVYLPASKKVVKEATFGQGEDLRGDQTILIVDDEELVLTMAETILQEFGYKVLKATSATKAVGLFSQSAQPVDLVITDLVMPGMGGRELIEKLRGMAPSTRIICTSGYLRNPKPDEDIEYLKKPFTSQDLLRKVKQSLQ